MATRDGKQFVDRLRRFPREVWIEGELVTDVAAHPAFRRSVLQLARLYDMQQEPELRDALTFVVPETGANRHSLRHLAFRRSPDSRMDIRR